VKVTPETIEAELAAEAAAERARKAARKAQLGRPPEPVEPDEVICEHCREPLWRVVGPNGTDLTLDRFQIETQYTMDGRVVRLEMANRSEVCNLRVSKQGGYRLHEPAWFSGGPDMAPAWTWCASRMSLDDAESYSVVIYSDHRITCEAVSENAIIQKATNIALEGDAAGGREGKRGYLLPAEMQAAKDLWLRVPARYLKPRKLSALRPMDRTAAGMPIFSKHGASQVRSFRSPARGSTPLEAGENRQLGLSLERE
jgi:hypothetical protein